MLIKHLVMKNIIWSNNRTQSIIMQMCVTRCTTANVSSHWFYLCSIFFLNLCSLFRFQYYKPLFFWLAYWLAFQNAPKIIFFSGLAWHSRISIYSSQAIFLVIFFNTHSICHTSVTSRLHLFSLKSTHFLRPKPSVTFPIYIAFPNIFSIFISSLGGPQNFVALF